MNRNRTARQHSFAIIPSPEVPRSKFRMRQTRKMGFNASELVPIMCEEVLPGDTWQHTESIMARLATPIAPLVDDLDLETWYFFVPNRITWPDWEDFITGKDTDLTVPTINPVDDGVGDKVIAGRIFDHFGILPQTYTGSFPINVLPVWAYLTTWNEWFRDQNLQEKWYWSPTWTNADSNTITLEETTATKWNQQCLRVNKRHDYFTSSLPWPQKGDAVSLSLGTTAPIEFITDATGSIARDPSTGTALNPASGYTMQVVGGGSGGIRTQTPSAVDTAIDNSNNLQADLSSATAVTINALRLAAVTQKLLELDARGGSRYVENLLAHWRVRSPDFRLQRPEYLGGSKTPITVNPIAQTAAYDAEPDPTAASNLGNLGAEMHVSAHRRTFTYAAVEHGYIIGVAAVRATPTYQQGTRKHWTRSARLDFWDPVFAGLGEQAVATQEIYQPANNTPSNATWGYQERAAEYRYTPNEITGPLRSTATLPMDWWHLSEEYASEPALNSTFITDKTQEVLARALAIDTATSEQWACQIIMDVLHDSNVARLMPAYSTPGMDKF